MAFRTDSSLMRLPRRGWEIDSRGSEDVLAGRAKHAVDNNVLFLVLHQFGERLQNS